MFATHTTREENNKMRFEIWEGLGNLYNTIRYRMDLDIVVPIVQTKVASSRSVVTCGLTLYFIFLVFTNSYGHIYLKIPNPVWSSKLSW